jgi:hypothetical protein
MLGPRSGGGSSSTASARFDGRRVFSIPGTVAGSRWSGNAPLRCPVSWLGLVPLGRFGSPMSDPSNPRIGFFPFKDRGFETFIRRDLIVRVRFLASLSFLRLVKTSTAAEK